jgi:small-conductance mechanosensitive channel
MQKLVSDFLRKWDLHPYVWNLILVAASILLGLLLSWILSLFVRKKTGTEMRFHLGQSLLRHLGGPTSVLWPLLLFNGFIPLLRMDASIRSRIETGVEICLIVAFAWFLIRIIRVGQDVVHYKINLNSKDNLRQRQIITQLIYIRHVASFIIILIAIGAVLLTFDTLRKIGTGLLTGVGIGGIIVGFAAQNSLANLLAGFQIAFTQPIRIDDQVIVENEFGTIEKITLTYVVVRLWDERRMVLPINYFLTKPFQNWTRTSANIIGSVYLYIDYSLPVEWVRQEFMDLIEKNPLWDKKASGLVVTDLKKDVMEIRAIVSAQSSGDAFNLRCQIREELIKRINEQFPASLPRVRAALVKEENKDSALS